MKKHIALCITLTILFAAMAGAHSVADNRINWTDEELVFRENHPVIRLGVDPRFVPFDFIDEDGEYKGIACDYLELVSERTGLQFEVCRGLTWPEAYDLALARQLDALPAIGLTTDRAEHFLFSEPYYYFKRVIATRDTDTQISGMKDLEGLTVAVQRNSSHHSYLLSYEKINLSLYDSVEAALVALATGEERAFIGNLATTNYLIRSTGLTNLRFVSFEAEKQQALYFAVRDDWPELVSIFNKAVNTISDKERIAINNKWIELETHLDFWPFIRAALIAFAFFAVVLAVSWFWIGRLRKEIKERKRVQTELEATNLIADEANRNLQEANSELEKMSMIDGLTSISNRRYFDSFLHKLWGINMRERFPVALIMVDVDHFKLYNDTYGHLGGDQCLKAVASIINETVKRSGDLVARFGGEEFAVLLSNTSEDDAVKLAEKIKGKIAEEVMNRVESTTPVTVSLGVAAMISTGDKTPDDLIYAADCALYLAKNNGRNRVERASSLPDSLIGKCSEAKDS